jgi:hypothetical protein
MKQTSFPMKPDGKLTIRTGSDLSIEGIEAATMVVIVDHGEGLRMKEDGGVFHLAADSDCRVILPFGVTVNVEKVGGDASIKNLSNRLVVGKTGGDLHLQVLEGASVETVGGDCVIQEASGAVEVQRVGGDLMAEVSGSLYVGSVGGDASVIASSGKVEMTVGGDARLKFVNANLPEARVKAGGEINMTVPEGANGQLELTSGGEDIQVSAGGQELEVENDHASLPLGNGGATITLTAGDNLQVSDRSEENWEFDDDLDASTDHWSDFGIDLEKTIKDSMKTVSESVRLAGEHANRAGQIAEEKMKQAMRHLEERGLGAGRKRKVVGFTFGDSASAAPIQTPKASDEERMLVLRMLQDKKITVEEAEKLLNALDR